ncbi:MAG: succinyl-diaminopimelate desuccinylase [Alphaproteobacteria bacterium]|nr:succinyl-diaminopimelate desuccinylase [Alphaproteobacteria bacterium]
MTDPVALAQALIRCPSVTPHEGGALDLLERTLTPLGFTCNRLRFEAEGTPPVENLYARFGDRAPHFCFAGHTDVVPEGARAQWSVDPFAGKISDGALWGRGAADMKGAIAAFVGAAARIVAKGRPQGSISLLITGDEEGPAVNGTKKVLDWLKARGEKLDACVVGEPSCPQALGDAIKIGRRGSLNGVLTVEGVQGHAAYPHLADNPVHRLVAMLSALLKEPLDLGSEAFEPSTLQITSVDVGNIATNVIPARANAMFNARFNDLHSGASLETHLRRQLDAVGGGYELAVSVSGESFLTPPGGFAELVAGAVAETLGRRPDFSTSGGTSDARFIKDHCPVVEFGLVGATMHKVDERVSVKDIEALARVYERVLERFFAAKA